MGRLKSDDWFIGAIHDLEADKTLRKEDIRDISENILKAAVEFKGSGKRPPVEFTDYIINCFSKFFDTENMSGTDLKNAFNISGKNKNELAIPILRMIISGYVLGFKKCRHIQKKSLQHLNLIDCEIVKCDNLNNFVQYSANYGYQQAMLHPKFKLNKRRISQLVMFVLGCKKTKAYYLIDENSLQELLDKPIFSEAKFKFQ